MDREELEDALCTLNGSIFFIVVATGSILLSWLALLCQRQQIRDQMEGTQRAGNAPIFSLRLGASALVIAALVYFFRLGLQRRVTACQGDDPAEKRSSWLNAMASVLVLAASLLRLEDLLFVEESGQSALLETDDQPPA